MIPTGDDQPLRNASAGYVRLYYNDKPELLMQWSIAGLLCVEHNANDGLTTSAEGMQHSVLVKVPVALDKPGNRFVISAKDSHADREKGHRNKWALERGLNFTAQQPAVTVLALEDPMVLRFDP